MKKRLAYNLPTYIKMGDGPVPVFLISFKRSEILSHFVILLPCYFLTPPGLIAVVIFSAKKEFSRMFWFIFLRAFKR